MQYKFSHDLVLGHKQIDLEHENIVIQMNELLEAVKLEMKSVQLVNILERNIKYIKEHFINEEYLMLSSNFYDFEKHRHIHTEFISILTDLLEDIKEYGYESNSLIENLHVRAIDLIVLHVKLEDSKLVNYLNSYKKTPKNETVCYPKNNENSHLLSLLNIVRAPYKKIANLRNDREFLNGKENNTNIDALTGVYNFNKCQEILDLKPTLTCDEDRAVVIFDLENIDKSNKETERKRNDRLVQFSNILQKITKTSGYENFIGRCAEEQFMVYFSNVDMRDIVGFIEDVKFSYHKEVAKQDKINIVDYFVAFEITMPRTTVLSNRQLFYIVNSCISEYKIALGTAL